ncbi:MAG: ACT domain-containing protein [Endomicrobiales bacterium]
MNINQISIFLENKKGRLGKVCDCLAKAHINVRALSLADTKDFGVLRLIVNDPDRCCAILKKNDFVVQETNVIAVEVEDRPGGLRKILALLERNNINVEYMYATVERSKNHAVVIFKVDQQQKAITLLSKNRITLMTGSKLNKM